MFNFLFLSLSDNIENQTILIQKNMECVGRDMNHAYNSNGNIILISNNAILAHYLRQSKFASLSYQSRVEQS